MFYLHICAPLTFPHSTLYFESVSICLLGLYIPFFWLLLPWLVWGSLQVLTEVSKTRMLKLGRLVCLWGNIGAFIWARIAWDLCHLAGRRLRPSQYGRQYWPLPRMADGPAESLAEQDGKPWADPEDETSVEINKGYCDVNKLPGALVPLLA